MRELETCQTPQRALQAPAASPQHPPATTELPWGHGALPSQALAAWERKEALQAAPLHALPYIPSQAYSPNAKLDSNLLQARMFWEDSMIHPTEPSALTPNYPPESVQESKTSSSMHQPRTKDTNPKVSLIIRNIFSNYNSNFNHTEASTSQSRKRHGTGIQTRSPSRMLLH